jgi:hypothetical protein
MERCQNLAVKIVANTEALCAVTPGGEIVAGHFGFLGISWNKAPQTPE